MGRGRGRTRVEETKISTLKRTKKPVGLPQSVLAVKLKKQTTNKDGVLDIFEHIMMSP